MLKLVIVSSTYDKFVFHFLVFKAEEDADRKKVYDTANFYHFVHTLALLGVPLTKRPVLVSSTNDDIMQSSMKLLKSNNPSNVRFDFAIFFHYLQSGTLIIAGTTVFCGTIYYHALTNEKQLRKYTPYGGIVLMMGWLSMIL